MRRILRDTATKTAVQFCADALLFFDGIAIGAFLVLCLFAV